MNMGSIIVAILGFIVSTIGTVAGWVAGYSRSHRDKSQAIEDGIMVLLRARLIDIHVRYVENDEPCPVNVKDEADDVYKAYHALKGNGTGTHLYNEIMDAHIAKGVENSGI